MKAADTTLRGLSLLNFAVAGMQAGFGAFVPMRLTESGWNAATIGYALSAGYIASVVAQVPSGIVIDRLGARRSAAAVAIVATMAALVMLSLVPSVPTVFLAEIVQGAAAVGLSLAIATITLCVSRQQKFGERLGRNVRYAAIGVVGATVLLGFVASTVSASAAFLVAAAFGAPALVALRSIGAADIATADRRTAHHTAAPPHARRPPSEPARALLRSPAVFGLFAVAALFQFANAALLPLAATVYTPLAGSRAGLVTAAVIIGPQLVAAALSPRVGVAAHRYGRRVVLMLGLVAVPLRALVFASTDTLPPILLGQLLDGVSAATIGVLVPLIAADITHRDGRFNVVLGTAGLVSAIGASLSTTVAGNIAVRFGLPEAFLLLAAAGLGAILAAWALLSETAHLPASLTAAPNGRIAA